MPPRPARSIPGVVLALVGAPGLAHAQVLHDNGPLATGDFTRSGVAAPAGTLWSECQPDMPPGLWANTLAGVLADLDESASRVADDFRVPAGQTWTVTALRFWAYQTGAGTSIPTITGVNARIWRGRPGDPDATPVWSSPGFPGMVAPAGGFATMYRAFSTVVAPTLGSAPVAPDLSRPLWTRDIAVPGLTLGEGVYWVDWQFAGLLTSGPWVPTVTRVGTRLPLVNPPEPGNARQSSAAAWRDVIDPGQPQNAPPVAQDLAFAVLGSTGVDCRADLNADGELTFDDIQLFVGLYNLSDARADFNRDEEWTFDDILLFVGEYNGGC